MLAEKNISPTFTADILLTNFTKIEDPRHSNRIRYPMPEVLFLVICSTLSGYESNRGIEEFGHLKLSWLRRYFPYIHGIPTHESIGNIIGLIDKQVFEECFVQWTSQFFGMDHELIHIDGKRLSSSVDKLLQDKKPSEGGKSADLIVNAYASVNQVVVAQVNVSESGDEKEGARQLIEQLHLRNTTISGDGNYCTKDIFKRIRAKGGDYMMTLKKNQPILYRICEQHFEDHETQLLELGSYQTKDRNHGREEYRVYQSLRVDQLAVPKFKEYKGLKQLVKVFRSRTVLRKKKTTEDIHYYMTSSDKPVEDLARMIRNHWSIENQLHWVLDVEFREDESRKRTGNQASNFSVIRKLVLNLINKHRGKKSIKAWRMSCAVSDQIRANTLGFS